MRIPVSVIAVTYMLAEIAGFILVGEAIGVLPTLGLIVLGMVAGTMLLRLQGFSTLRKVQADLAAGKAPARPLAEGAAQAAGALLIIVPGFVSDIVGIALFVPAVRELLWRAIRRRGQFRTVQHAPGASRPAVIDLEPGDFGARKEKGGVGDSPWRAPGDFRP
jgi:UPF0716 protein FxsA